jgi:hypothetical protein
MRNVFVLLAGFDVGLLIDAEVSKGFSRFVPEGAAEVKIPASKMCGQGKFGHRFRGKVVLRADNCAGYEGGRRDSASEQELHGASTRTNHFATAEHSIYLADKKQLTHQFEHLCDIGSFRAVLQVPVKMTLEETS